MQHIEVDLYLTTSILLQKALWHSTQKILLHTCSSSDFVVLQDSAKPYVAAIMGTCLGGGLEVQIYNCAHFSTYFIVTKYWTFVVTVVIIGWFYHCTCSSTCVDKSNMYMCYDSIVHWNVFVLFFSLRCAVTTELLLIIQPLSFLLQKLCLDYFLVLGELKDCLHS